MAEKFKLTITKTEDGLFMLQRGTEILGTPVTCGDVEHVLLKVAAEMQMPTWGAQEKAAIQAAEGE